MYSLIPLLLLSFAYSAESAGQPNQQRRSPPHLPLNPRHNALDRRPPQTPRLPRKDAPALLQPVPRQAPPRPRTYYDRIVDFTRSNLLGKRSPHLGPGPDKDYDPEAARAIYRKRAEERREARKRSSAAGNNGPEIHRRQTDMASSSLPSPSATSSASAANTTAPLDTFDDTPVWILDDVYKGQNFFDYWYFWNHPDVTNGLVAYVNRDEAFQENLAYITNDDIIVMKADNKTKLNLGDWRKSVRIESLKEYTGGLFILDMDRAPYGCGIWPAWWTAGGNWPYEGEIDIYEGVHESTNNQVAWHTGPGCKLVNTGNFTGKLLAEDCNGLVNDNKGCAISDSNGSSSGSTFKDLGGGVYAMKWDDKGISIWFFPRAVVPTDITSFTPDPTQWGKPSAHLSPKGCDIIKHFQNHKIIINITFCGDWAGTSFTSSGCGASCAERVVDPKNFDNAYWRIHSVRVYTNAQLEAGILSGAPRRIPSPTGRWSLLAGLGVVSITIVWLNL